MNTLEQTSIPLEQEEKAYLSIKPILCDTLHGNGLTDDEKLCVNACQSYYSVLFEKSVIFRIYNRKQPYITVPTFAITSSKFADSSRPLKDGYSKIYIGSLSKLTEYAEMLQMVLQAVLDSRPNDFDCCSRYEDCSDAKRCIHPNKEFALGCGYRKILKSGRIFYGENRNID